VRAGLCARVSRHDQQALPLQLAEMRDYVAKRGWRIALEVQDVGSGVSLRPKREELLKAARRRELDQIVVWRLDPLRTLARRPRFYPARACAAGGRLRLAERSARPDHAQRASPGGNACGLRRIRTQHLARPG